MIHPDIIEREGKEYYSKEYLDRIIKSVSKSNFEDALDLILRNKIELYLDEYQINEIVRYHPLQKVKNDEFINRIFENIKHQMFYYYESLQRKYLEDLKEIRRFKAMQAGCPYDELPDYLK